MNKISFPLKRGMNGGAVADLQAALQTFLDRSLILPNDEPTRRQLSSELNLERPDNFFGGATRKLVTLFQELRGLTVNGEVDEPTAKAMNETLQEIGLFDTPRQDRSSVVSGRLRYDDETAVDGRIVRAFHESDGNAVRLGEDTSDAEGRYTIRYELLQDVSSVNLRVEVTGEKGSTTQSSDLIRNARSLEIVDFVLPVTSKLPDQRRLEGQILFDNGQPAEKLRLRLYRIDFGGVETRLNEATTREQGHYALAFDLNGQRAGLEIKAVDADDVEMALSMPIYDLGEERRVVINLVAPAGIVAVGPEFSRMSADISPHVGGDPANIKLAREDHERSDLTTLHEVTGWDARLIALAAKTHQLADESRLSPKVLYGLARAGLPTDRQLLARIPQESVDVALTRSQNAGIVSLDAAETASFKADFATFASNTRRESIVAGTRSSIGELLNQSALTDAEKTTFENLHFIHGGRGEEFWKNVRDAGIDEPKIAGLRLQGKLAYLTRNNAPLTAILQNEVGSLDRISDLVDKDLHRSDTWSNRLQAIAGNDSEALNRLIPPAYEGKSDAARLASYADDLARNVRVSFPMRVVGRMLETKELNLGVQHDAVQAPIRTFLKNAETLGFKLGQAPIETFVRDNRATLFPNSTPEEIVSTTQSVKRLSRLYQISSSDEALKVLTNEGFHSARDVVSFPPEAFLDRFGDKFRTREEARLVYRKAQEVTVVTHNFFGIAKQLESAPPIHAISVSQAQRDEVRDNLIKHFPTMESLFGSLDFCECDQCQSVLSPAAYLVDLFQFLDPSDLVWNNFLGAWKDKHDQEGYVEQYGFAKPFDALIERRPDLQHLPLTCENTNTALPYIDIVNEILEYYVANNKLDENVAYDTGRATTPELLAEPQNTMPKAYELLKAKHYPLNLPFDCWLETVRGFFNYFEIPLANALGIFRSAELPTATGVTKLASRMPEFMENLGLSSSEIAMFTDPAGLATWFNLYGFSDQATALTALNSAKSLSRRLSVSYKELVLLVQTQFVNPRLEVLTFLHKLGVGADVVFRFKGQAGHAPLSSEETIAFESRLKELARSMKLTVEDVTARIDAAWLNGNVNEILVLRDPDTGTNFDLTTLQFANGTTATPLVFTKLNLFVRLWRKLGGTIQETDRTLRVFAGDSARITDNTLLCAALSTALLHTSQLQKLAARLQPGKNGRERLLTLWSNLSTTGTKPIYAQLFLTPSVLKNDLIFDDPLGSYLSNASILGKDHLLALQGALNVTVDDINQILEEEGLAIETARLTLENVSLLYRYSLLAKALKYSVSELITLKQLSGLNPFAALPEGVVTDLDQLVTFTQTVRFVEVSDIIKASPLHLEEINYLARHRFDPVGKYRLDTNALLVLVKNLADDIRRIRAENAIPIDAADFTDEILAQKLGLVLPPDVASTFMAMWNGTRQYEFVRLNTNPDQALKPDDFAADADIQVSYRPLKLAQQLTYRGVLFDTRRQELIGRILSPILDEMLSNVQSQAREYFEKYFQQSSDSQNPLGFLGKGDFVLLFAPPVAQLADVDRNDPVKLSIFLAARKEEDRGKRKVLANAFLPFLQQKLIRRFIVQTLSTNTNSDPVLLESLLVDLLALPDSERESLLTTFLKSDRRGVSAEFFTSRDLSGNPIGTPTTIDAIDLPNIPATAGSSRFHGYLEVQASGGYRFFTRFGAKDIEAEFRLNLTVAPLIKHTSTSNFIDAGGIIDEASGFIELRAGILYEFQLELRNLQQGPFKMLVQGETMPKDQLSQLTLYPYAAVQKIQRAYVLLTKVLQLIQTYGFSEREVRYLFNNAARVDAFDPGALPTSDAAPSVGDSNKLFSQFLRLADYTCLKESLGTTSDDLISLFEAPALEDKLKRIAEMTRRELPGVKAAAAVLNFTDPALLADAPGLQRLWDILQLVERIGIPVGAIVRSTAIISSATTPEDAFSIARDLRNTIKARYDSEGWQHVAKPIFDKLRQRQRDALVSWIMHDEGFARIDELFEYFLIDPGMEPVVQTSRLRLAISAVQTFVQRCLLNLESRVHPTALNAKHWEWMKRYRVWEANRKIFLYPENWLEPEFRDDKTNIFQELESELLQGDVSNDLAEDAFFRYLTKLDQLARLEMVSMYCEEMPDPASNIIHVIGRTYSLPHKYFYRKYAHRMWTPWEPVSADIEGDHVVAVVWRERFHLFWITFLEKAAHDSKSLQKTDDTHALQTLTFNDLAARVDSGSPVKVIEAQLNWSEYYQGAWSTRESSGFADPVRATVGNNYDPRTTFIHVSKEIHDGEDRAVKIHLGGQIGRAFRIISKNSPPEIIAAESVQAPPYTGITPNRATQYTGNSALQVDFVQQVRSEDGKPVQTVSAPQGLIQSPLGSGGFSLLICANPATTIDGIQGYVSWLTAFLGATLKPTMDKVVGFAKSLPVRFSNPSETVNQGALAELAALHAETLAVSTSAIQNAELLPAVVGVASGLIGLVSYLVNRFIQAGESVGTDEELRADIRKYVTPFFFQDNQNSFFVEPTLAESTLEEWQEWVIPVHHPPIAEDHEWLKEIFLVAAVPSIHSAASQATSPSVKYSRFQVRKPTDWATHPATAVKFGQISVGQTGAFDAANTLTQAGQSASFTISEGLNAAAAARLATLSRFSVHAAATRPFSTR